MSITDLSDSDNEARRPISSHPSTTTTPLSEHMEQPSSSYCRLSGPSQDLYTESNAAKIWRVAQELLNKDATLSSYPEYVPHDGDTPGHFNLKPVQFWTCGFFPGSLYCIYERAIKYPKSLQLAPPLHPNDLRSQLLALCRAWSAPLHAQAYRTNTHDLGFITQPALRQDWELTGNIDSYHSLVTAAHSLASRWDHRVGAIRSWDKVVSNAYNIADRDSNFLIIVDSMCNMDLLFYVASHTGDKSLAEKATAHARTVLRTLVREDFTTSHVANLDPRTGNIMMQFTHQGHADDSLWARGQAWAILGFTQTYIWTKSPEFLDAAIRLSDVFLTRCSKTRHSHPYVPPWDFDAPKDTPTLRDSSAGMIAANGMLLLHQYLSTSLQSEAYHSPSNPLRYLKAVFNIISDTVELCLKPLADHHTVKFQVEENIVRTSSSSKEEERFDAILAHATANNNRNALVRYADHGLVYADYYFLELGNKLLRMGLV